MDFIRVSLDGWFATGAGGSRGDVLPPGIRDLEERDAGRVSSRWGDRVTREWGLFARGTHRARTAHPNVVHHLRDLVRGSVRDVVSRRGPAVGSQDDSTVVHARHDRGLLGRRGNTDGSVERRRGRERRLDLGGNVFFERGAGAHPGGHLLHQFGRHAERGGNSVIHHVSASPASELEICRGVREM